MPRTWRTQRKLEDPAERRLRRQRRSELHVAPLNRLVLEMRHDGQLEDDAATIPYVDPAGGGVDARVLFLLQDPSQVAASTTGLISPDNPDPTADNLTWLRDEAGLDPRLCLHWNVVPWFIGKRPALVEAQRARPWLARFLGELHHLRVVVCVGNLARDAWDALHTENQCEPGWVVRSMPTRALPVLWCPHTSFHNIDGGHSKKAVDGLTPKDRIVLTFAQARAHALAGVLQPSVDEEL